MRVITAVLAAEGVLGCVNLLVLKGYYDVYVIAQDWKIGTALITREAWSGHGVVGYEYRVKNAVYAGEGPQDLITQGGKKYGVGGKVAVYYAARDPRRSTLIVPTMDRFEPSRLAMIVLGDILMAWLIIVWVRHLRTENGPRVSVGQPNEN